MKTNNNNKGELSMQVIVIAIISLIVLVVIIMIFMKQTGKGSESYTQISAGITERYCEGLIGGRECTNSCEELKRIGGIAKEGGPWMDCAKMGNQYCCKKETPK